MTGWVLVLFLVNGETWHMPVKEADCKGVPAAMAQGAKVAMPFLDGMVIPVARAVCTQADRVPAKNNDLVG